MSTYGDAAAQASGYMESLTGKVLERAQALAGPGKTIEPWDLNRAILEYAPGQPIQEIIQHQVEAGVAAASAEPWSWRRSLLRSISGVTIIAAVLAIVFGVLGFVGVGGTSGFLDISKIFAGAIVGSTATGAAAEVRARSD
jgi:hypothetical protein